MVKKIAFLFPGQGAQTVGMGKDLYEEYEAAKNVYDIANNVLERSISDICFNGPEDALKQTVNTQPCIVTTSIAAMEVLRSALNLTPDYTAGHSLGEYCAMFTAGVMSLETTLKLIQKRADLMGATKGGSMAAVLNANDDVLKAGLKEGSKIGYVDVANYNSPAQVVITGDSEAVKAAGDYMLANGARRVVPLAVSGAYAAIPVVTNVDAEPTTLAEDFRRKMPRQIYSSVHWTQTIQKMAADGVDTFIEIGPGKVLAGLNKKIVPEAVVYNIFDKASLETTISALKEQMASV